MKRKKATMNKGSKEKKEINYEINIRKKENERIMKKKTQKNESKRKKKAKIKKVRNEGGN